MAVISFKEIHDGRDSETSVRGSSQRVTTRRFTRVFRAVTNSNDDDGSVVKAYASCPRVGNLHPSDIGCWCQSVRARNESFSKTVWIVTALYSSEIEVSANPLSDPADIEWATEQFTRPYFKDRDGNWILNSAGDPFDPSVEGDDSRWVAVIQKNVSAVPTWILTYRDAVNAAACVIDGVNVGAGDAKIMALQISRWQERNDVKYRVLTLNIAVDEDGWAKHTLDAGYRELDGTTGNRKNIHNDGDDELPSSPVSLDGAGSALANPTPATAVGITSNIYKEKDFSVLPLN